MERSGITPAALIGVTSHALDPVRKTKDIWDKVIQQAVFTHARPPGYFKLVVSDCKYSDPFTDPCPFPCNPWYDRKAWHWLRYNVGSLVPPVLFWNIGA
jgi:hypothetical protein